MSLHHPFNFHESQPEVTLETFEDLATARKAVGEIRGLNDPVTADLFDATNHSLGANRHDFQPKIFVGDEARLIVHSLKKVAKTREDELALSASDALSRMPPLRLRAGMFMTGLLRQREPVSTDAPKPVSGPLLDPSHPEPRPPIVWESKYDNSRKGRRSKLA